MKIIWKKYPISNWKKIFKIFHQKHSFSLYSSSSKQENNAWTAKGISSKREIVAESNFLVEQSGIGETRVDALNAFRMIRLDLEGNLDLRFTYGSRVILA